ncbi:MAG: hypothetical protein JW774_00530 [Candidatus Aureabacteria bacterium]|nr:hypothetical protein [Candidatus Auribacterota bacterium]
MKKLFFIILLCSDTVRIMADSLDETSHLSPASFYTVSPEKKEGSSTKNHTQIIDLRPVPIYRITSFIHRHPDIKRSYYDDRNPSYPAGCESYCYIVSEELQKN